MRSEIKIIFKKVNHIHLGLIYSLNFKLKWMSVYSLCFLNVIIFNEYWYVKIWQMVLLLWRNENEKCNISQIAIDVLKQ